MGLALLVMGVLFLHPDMWIMRVVDVDGIQMGIMGLALPHVHLAVQVAQGPWPGEQEELVAGIPAIMRRVALAAAAAATPVVVPLVAVAAVVIAAVVPVGRLHMRIISCPAVVVVLIILAPHR